MPKINRFNHLSGKLTDWGRQEDKCNIPDEAEKVFVYASTPPQWKIIPIAFSHKNLCIPTMQQRDRRGGKNINHGSRAVLSAVGVHPDRLPAPEQWLVPCMLHSLHLRYTRQSSSFLHLGSAPCEHGADNHRSQRSTSSRGKSNLPLPPRARSDFWLPT